MAKNLMTMHRRFMGLLSILGVVSIALLLYFNIWTVPNEDALILHQYSRNLAQTGVISYIPGGVRAEGATDFLWMVYLSMGFLLGLSPGLLTAVANVACVVVLALVLLRMAKSETNTTNVLAILGVVALTPQFQASLRGFSPIPFATGIALTTLCLLEEREIGGALAALMLCLLRPDGVVLAIPLLSAYLIRTRFHLRALGNITIFFILPGLIYFLWRWHYFGELFPLPFLVKSNAHRQLGLFIWSSVQDQIRYVLFSTAVCIIFFRPRARTREFWWQVACLLVVPFFFYSNIVHLQNLDDRFFVYVPLGLAVLVSQNWREVWRWERRRSLQIIAGLYVFLFLFSVAASFASNIEGIREWRRMRDLTSGLRDLPHGKLLTTEAGFLSYYPGWATYDALGLDTAEFARRNIQPDQVARLHADIIVLHDGKACLGPSVSAPVLERGGTAQLAANMRSGMALGPEQYETWSVPYWTPEKERSRIALHKGEDDECWYLSVNYPGLSGVRDLLRRYQATPLKP